MRKILNTSRVFITPVCELIANFISSLMGLFLLATGILWLALVCGISLSLTIHIFGNNGSAARLVFFLLVMNLLLFSGLAIWVLGGLGNRVAKAAHALME